MERTRLLFGQFRKGEANDPVTFAAAIGAVLSQYPEEVIVAATDPRTGLASRTDWLPTSREVRVICEELVRPIQETERRRRDLERQFADGEVDRSERPSLAEMRAKYGKNWGLAVDDRPTAFQASAMATLCQLAAKAGVTDEQIRAMPNAPKRMGERT
jgi:hypothetical protein